MRLKAWDGSEAGPVDAPLVVLNSADAVRRLLWRPGELGAAQAYVTGEIDVPGDLDHALTHAFAVAKERGLSRRAAVASAAARAPSAPSAGIGALGRPPAAPASQAKLRGRLHSQLRDRSAISFHYDLSNEFYAADPRAADGLLVRLPLLARRHRRAGAVRQARRWSAASSASSRG